MKKIISGSILAILIGSSVGTAYAQTTPDVENASSVNVQEVAKASSITADGEVSTSSVIVEARTIGLADTEYFKVSVTDGDYANAVEEQIDKATFDQLRGHNDNKASSTSSFVLNKSSGVDGDGNVELREEILYHYANDEDDNPIFQIIIVENSDYDKAERIDISYDEWVAISNGEEGALEAAKANNRTTVDKAVEAESDTDKTE